MERQEIGDVGEATAAGAHRKPRRGGTEEVKTQGEGTKEAVKAKADEAKHAVKEKAEETKETLKAAGREQKERLEARAEEKVAAQKQVAARRAHALASALREAGATLERDGEAELGRYGRQAAEQVERAAGYFERNDLNGFVHDLERTARDHPGAFVGGTFAAGVMLGRFLRSSRPEPAATDAWQGGGRTDGSGIERTDARAESTIETTRAASAMSPGGSVAGARGEAARFGAAGVDAERVDGGGPDRPGIVGRREV
jgi:hypothetical protein